MVVVVVAAKFKSTSLLLFMDRQMVYANWWICETEIDATSSKTKTKKTNFLRQNGVANEIYLQRKKKLLCGMLNACGFSLKSSLIPIKC